MASTAPQDNGGSLRKSIGLIELFTFWTCEPIRPAQAFQIGSAGGIVGKNPLKIGKRCWKAAGVHSGKLSPIHRIDNKPDRQTCLYIAVDGKMAGLVPYADQIRPESPSVIQRLKEMGIRNTIMLTGDNPVVARAVAERLGLTHHYADMLPVDKAEVIQKLQREGKIVAMVGDGINDSPALSFADVGIAMKHGAEVTHESADVVLMEDSLWKLVKAVEISRDSVALIKQNYAIVVGMNTFALVLALPGGLISPSVTALISNGSAIVASLNGMRPLLRSR